jgi:hypothetical protein
MEVRMTKPIPDNADRGDDFNGNLLDETLKPAALTVLPELSHHQKRSIFREPGEDDPDAGLDLI